MDALFGLAETLFGIDVVPADGVAPVNSGTLYVVFLLMSIMLLCLLTCYILLP